ncbi:hypothetical protein [Photobacterium salinisoli]|uniref:hypothetical protein n=1 Tax=Photobacterium salinisoli TaxID=1616783 RepID=UPI000EA3978E|nr:hypothetical protein [Photobacterium salinisoli]
MPESIKTPAKTKFPKCEPCQSRLAFIEAYRDIRTLYKPLEYLGEDSRQSDAIKTSVHRMINSMPYKKARFYDAAAEANRNQRYSVLFEEMHLKLRAALRLYNDIAVKGMMPETALAQRDDEAFL